MALKFSISQEAANELLATRISEYLLDHPEVKRGSGKFNAMPDTVTKRAEPLAQIAYEHFAPKVDKGTVSLKNSLQTMCKPGSALSKTFAKYLEDHQSNYPFNFYEKIKDESVQGNFRYSAQPMADKLVNDLCTKLSSAMFVSQVQAAPVSGHTPQAKDLAARIAAQAATGRSAA